MAVDRPAIPAATRQGYEYVDDDGRPLLCKREERQVSKLGEALRCLTPEQWHELNKYTEQELEAMRRAGTAPIAME